MTKCVIISVAVYLFLFLLTLYAQPTHAKRVLMPRDVRKLFPCPLLQSRLRNLTWPIGRKLDDEAAFSVLYEPCHGWFALPPLDALQDAAVTTGTRILQLLVDVCVGVTVMCV